MSSKTSSSSDIPELSATDELLRTIGKATISWALVETALEFCIDEIHHRPGKNPPEKEIPRTAFNRKLRYLRKFYNSDEHPNGHRKEILEKLDILKHMSDTRHMLIHGIIINLHEYETLGFAEVESRDKKDPNLFRRGKTDTDRILRFGQKCLDLAREWILISAALQAANNN